MSPVPGLRPLVVLLVLAGLLLPLAPAGLAADPEVSTVYGRSAVPVPERTDEGEWSGTWFYVSRSRKMALWIRQEDGEIRLRLRLQGQGSDPDSFTTDWDGQAEYDLAGRSGRFSMSFDRKDENTISGSWIWETRVRGAGRVETARFTMYRIALGRQLVWHVTDIDYEHRGRAEQVPAAGEFVWLFRKASRRQVLWNELPF
jgi:hypothetical protein